MIEQLREVAAQLRKAAASISDAPVDTCEKTAVDRVELDPGKVRDFLVFFGASK